MKLVIKIIRFIFIIIVISLTLICAVYLYNKHINHTTYIGDYTSFVVTGGSMEPTLTKDDLIIIKKAASYKVDDIITYDNEDGGITTHRIIEKIDETTYKTKGDSNNYIDGYDVSKKDVYGKVVANIKQINKLLKFVLKYKYYCIGAVILIPFILKLLSKV